jgi:hypothetical protein
MMSKANESQVGGSHYAGKTQHWDYVVDNDLDYFQGQITKYVTRCRKKNGKQDLEKAKHFIEKYLEIYDKMYPAIVKDEQSLKTGATVEYPSTFTVEGYYGDGTDLYQCKKCRKAYRLPRSNLDPVWQHHSTCGQSKDPVPDPAEPGHGYVDQDPEHPRKTATSGYIKTVEK